MTAGNHSYTVVASNAYGDSAESEGYGIYVRQDSDYGAVVSVGAPSGGDDTTAIQTAINTAEAAGGGIVEFQSGVYLVGSNNNATWVQGYHAITIDDDKVLLRGAGMGTTTLRARGGSTTNLSDVSMIRPYGLRTALTGTNGTAITMGTRAVTVTSTTGMAVGQAVALDPGSAMWGTQEDPGVASFDPDHNDTLTYDINEIESIVGTTVTFKYPISSYIQANAPWFVIGNTSAGCGIELMTLEGPTANNTTFRALLQPSRNRDFTAANVEFKNTNRACIETFDCYRLSIVGCEFPRLGESAIGVSPASSLYTLNLRDGVEVAILGCTFGVEGNGTDQTRSCITLNKTHRAIARHNTFHGSNTYAFNEHGEQSHHWRFENNLVAEMSVADYGGCNFGNEAFTFSSVGMVRNVRFSDVNRAVRSMDNSCEIRFWDLYVDGITEAEAFLIYGSDFPATDPSNYGSLRMTFRRIQFIDADGIGISLGELHTSLGRFPYNGARDFIINECDFSGVTGVEVDLNGTIARYEISDNVGIADAGTDIDGDYWDEAEFDWEQYDLGIVATVHEITPNSMSIAVSSPAPAVTGVHAVTAANLAVAVAASASSVAVMHEVSPAPLAVALSSPSPAVTGTHELVSANMALAVAETSPVVTGVHELVSANMLVGVGATSPAVTQLHETTPQSMGVATTVESPAVLAGVTALPNDVLVATSASAPAITQLHETAPANMLVGVQNAPAAVTQDHQLTAFDMSLLTTTTSPVVTGAHEVAPAALNVGTFVGIPVVTAGGDVGPDNMSVATTSTSPSVTQLHELTVADLNLAIALNSPVIQHIHIISPADLLLAVQFSNPGVTQEGDVVPDDVMVGTMAGVPTITQDHFIVPQDQLIVVTADGSSVTQVHVLSVNDIYIATFTQEGFADTFYNIDPADMLIGISIPDAIITPGGVAIPPPRERSHLIKFERRSHLIKFENRTANLR
jgi:hypothetical protein